MLPSVVVILGAERRALKPLRTYGCDSPHRSRQRRPVRRGTPVTPAISFFACSTAGACSRTSKSTTRARRPDALSRSRKQPWIVRTSRTQIRGASRLGELWDHRRASLAPSPRFHITAVPALMLIDRRRPIGRSRLVRNVSKRSPSERWVRRADGAYVAAFFVSIRNEN
jgi:hypothetical protein